MGPSSIAPFVLSPAAPNATSNSLSREGCWAKKVKATVALAMAFMSVCILAQDDQVAVRPGPVTFGPWRKESATEFYDTYVAEFTSAYVSGVSENDTVRLSVVMPSGQSAPVPVAVLLHYWGATDLSVEMAVGRELAKDGVASVVMTLPYHLSRTPKGRKSGELAIPADPQGLIAMMTQSVWDYRRTLDWIESRTEFDSKRIGIGGTSLGAIVAALCFGVDDRANCASFLLGGADIAGLMWNSSKVVAQREAMRRRGITLESLSESIAPIEPLKYLEKSDVRPTLVVGARHDTVVPVRNVEKLAEALGSTELVWLDSGHYGGALVQNRLIRLVARFLASKLLDRVFVAPGSIAVPSIRLGVAYIPDDGLQVGATVDAWRSTGNPSLFASPMLTTQGLRLFVGTRPTNGLAVGAVVLPKRVSWGAFWSVVF